MVCFSIFVIRFGHFVHMACSQPAPARRQVDYAQLCLIFLQVSESFRLVGAPMTATYSIIYCYIELWYFLIPARDPKECVG